MVDLDTYIAQLKAHPELAALVDPLLALIEVQARRIAELEAEVTVLQAEVTALRAEVATLRERLGQTSRTSHQPPSSDGYRKAPALPKPRPGKRGGQPGHQGDTLKMVAQPDLLDEARPERCLSCGGSLQAAEPTSQERRQVFELPEPRYLVREYRRFSCTCPQCGATTQAAFPEGVTAPVQYGASVLAAATLLHQDYHVPVEKVSRLFGDLFGHPINEATVLAASARSFEALAQSEAAIRQALIKAETLNVDETGLRVEGRLHWLHVASNEALSYFFVHQRRGKAALESAASILPAFRGYLIHDCLPSYFGFDECAHGLCGAHLIRELRAQAEQGAVWAEALGALLMEAYRQARGGPLPEACYHQLRARYFALLRQGVAAHPLPARRPGGGRQKRGKARSLIDRLRVHHEAVWAFARVASVPFTNNQAERDLRPAKVKQKVSGGFRTQRGAAVFARVRGFCSSVRKQGRQVFKELCRALQEPDYVLLDPNT